MDRSLEEDFGDFVDAASPRLLGLAWNLGGVEHEAQDLVQTLERVHVRWREVVVPAQELAETAPSRAEAGPATVDLVSALRRLARASARWSCCATTLTSPSGPSPTGSA